MSRSNFKEAIDKMTVEELKKFALESADLAFGVVDRIDEGYPIRLKTGNTYRQAQGLLTDLKAKS